MHSESNAHTLSLFSPSPLPFPHPSLSLAPLLALSALHKMLLCLTLPPPSSGTGPGPAHPAHAATKESARGPRPLQHAASERAASRAEKSESAQTCDRPRGSAGRASAPPRADPWLCGPGTRTRHGTPCIAPQRVRGGRGAGPRAPAGRLAGHATGGRADDKGTGRRADRSLVWGKQSKGGGGEEERGREGAGVQSLVPVVRGCA